MIERAGVRGPDRGSLGGCSSGSIVTASLRATMLKHVDGRRPLERFVSELVWDHYLPSIQGGRSCWILRTSRRGEPLGVLRIRYFRFDGLRLLHHDASPDLAKIGPSLFFEYATQKNPDDVFSRLLAAP